LAAVNVQRRASVLARIELFRAVDEATRTRIAEQAVARVYERRQLVFLQGSPSDRLYVWPRGP
jgi:CRP-like cAMP-binding protein